MHNERYYWEVCFDDGNVWDCIGTYKTRADAEAELRRVQSGVFPDAFLVRLTIARTRMEPVHQTTTLTAV